MVMDDLSRGYTLLYVSEAKMLGFQTVQVLYKEDLDFKKALQGELKEGQYSFQGGYLFK